MTAWQYERLEDLQKLAKLVEPTAKIFIKETSSLMKFLNVFARLFNPTFMSTAGVTIGNRIYLPSAWLTRGVEDVVIHECRHVTQCRWCGLGIHPMVGLPVFLILYGLLPFPIGVAVCRYLFELDAFSTAWKWRLLQGASTEEVRREVDWEAEVVSGWKYFRPWPSSLVKKGFQKKLARILSDTGATNA